MKVMSFLINCKSLNPLMPVLSDCKIYYRLSTKCGKNSEISVFIRAYCNLCITLNKHQRVKGFIKQLKDAHNHQVPGLAKVEDTAGFRALVFKIND